jgi:deazaflavin-dependent oxidoreductase (nitroreductase family)
MPSDFQLKTMNAVHKGLLKVSFGKLGWRAGGMPALELTTKGRKSGEARTVMLTSPVQDGDKIVIVASRGGDPTHPAWFLNLRDDPNVEVAYAGKPKAKMTAKVLTGAERAPLWEKVVTAQPRYGEYQKKTDREIPLVVLTPA